MSPDWMDDAICRGMPIEVFFPGKESGKVPELAIALCTQCPVREQCADYGLYERVVYWGGTTETERRRRRRERAGTRVNRVMSPMKV